MIPRTLAPLPALLLLAACAAPAQRPAVDVAASPAPASQAPESQQEAPAAQLTSAELSAAAAAPSPIPNGCATNDRGTCLPDAQYVKKLCGGVYPEVALWMFGKDTPWTRMYLSGNTESWNTAGGRSVRTKLAFDEEVIVLARRAPRAGGIVMTGIGDTFDVLRWDGTCVSLEQGEITPRKPPQAKRATIPWPHLTEATRSALRAAPKVEASLARVAKECDGLASANDAAKAKCTKAEAALTNAIADYVRAGATLPTPSRRP
jgi:hypothetical protein